MLLRNLVQVIHNEREQAVRHAFTDIQIDESQVTDRAYVLNHFKRVICLM